MTTRVSIIDAGTNSTLMLVADLAPEISIIDDRAITTRLGEKLEKNGFLMENAIVRTLTAVEEFLQLSKRVNAKKIIIFGTSALRKAENASDFKKRILDQTGYSIKVLNEEEEGKYSYISVAKEKMFNKSRNVVIDIGGGSTEFIYGRGEEIERTFSFPIGCVTVTERFYKHDPPTHREIEKSYEVINNSILSLSEITPDFRIIGIGGTITTLAAMKLKLKRFDRNPVHNTPLSYEEVKKFEECFIASTPEERKSMTGLEAKRADIILAGTIILAAFMKQFDIQEVITSTAGVRYGILYSLN